MHTTIHHRQRAASFGKSAAKVVAFFLGIAFIQRIGGLYAQGVLWLARQGYIRSSEATLTLLLPDDWLLQTVYEPTLTLIYIIAALVFLFDVRSALSWEDSGLRPAALTALACYVTGVLFFVASDLIDLRAPDILGALAAATDLWPLLTTVFIPVVYAYATDTTGRRTLKVAAVLTAFFTGITGLGYYAEGVTTPLEYTSTTAFLLDPLFETVMLTFTGLFNGVVFAGVVLLLGWAWSHPRVQHRLPR